MGCLKGLGVLGYWGFGLIVRSIRLYSGFKGLWCRVSRCYRGLWGVEL